MPLDILWPINARRHIFMATILLPFLNVAKEHGSATLLIHTVKPVSSGHSKRRPKLMSLNVFKTDYRLMQVKSIAECSKGSILQYF